MPTGIDQSWGYADPAAAKAAGVRVVSMYLSLDPSKNVTAAKVKAYHQAGIGVLLNWENDAGAPLKGAGQGRSDAANAVRQVNALLAAVGYRPANRLVVYFSCDRDVTSAQWGTIDDYYRAVGSVCRPDLGVGAYGEASLISHLAKSRITDAEWQTLAWSGGVISPDADFYQSSINQTLGGASVDFDKVIHPALLGAWWPRGSTYDTGDDMSLTAAQAQQLANAVAYAKAADVRAQALQSALANALTRIAALQADVAALKANGSVTVQPADLPVTGTLHVGSGNGSGS